MVMGEVTRTRFTLVAAVLNNPVFITLVVLSTWLSLIYYGIQVYSSANLMIN